MMSKLLLDFPIRRISGLNTFFVTIQFRVRTEFITSQQKMGSEIFSSKMFLEGKLNILR